MDTEWAKGVLRNWINLVRVARAVGDYSPLGESIGSGRSQAGDLVAVEDQTRRVVERVLGGSHPLLPMAADEYLLTPGDKAVRLALGRLDTEAETRERLGSEAPTMAADSLHELIWSAASSLWDSGHYGQAVQRAATMLSGHVQDRVDRHDVSDSALMQEVFSDKAPQENKARLMWPGANDDQTVKSMRAGLRMVASGLYLAVRNPVTHGTDAMSRQDGLERLASLSMVARWVDGCDVLRVP